MSETISPVRLAFDLQRNAIEQTHDAVTRGIETQQEFGAALFDFGPAKEANARGHEAVRAVVDAYFDAVESATPGRQDLLVDLRAAVDEQLRTLEATQIEAIESVEANVRGDAAAELEFLEQFTAIPDEQFETVLDAHGDIEDQTVEAVESLEGDIEELRSELEAHREEVAENVESQFEQATEQFEAQIADLEQQLEDVTVEVIETTAQQADAQSDAADADESLETIDGLGPTYADRLRDRGIESLGTLAQTSADTVAEAADVSEERATTWIEAAQSR